MFGRDCTRGFTRTLCHVILQRIYGAFVANESADLTVQPKVWSDICSNDLETVFFGSSFDSNLAKSTIKLRDLLIRILVTDFCRSLLGDAPRQLAHFVLPERSLAANASVFISRWRSDIAQFSSYNALAEAASHELD